MDRYWVGGSGFWSDGSNWNPLGQPQAGDSAYLTPNDSVNRTVTFEGSAQLMEFIIDTTGTGSLKFNVFSGPLDCDVSVRIAPSGTVTVNQSGGQIATSSSGGIRLGDSPGSNFTYNLSDGGLSANNSYISIGDGGSGTFNQTGGTLSIDTHVAIGPLVAYNMSGGHLGGGGSSNLIENGTFNQTGGEVNVNNSQIDGTYNLGAGTLSAGLVTRVSGIINQSGGEFSSNAIMVASSGKFNFSGGELQLPDGGILTNNGTINLSGNGTRTIDGNIINNGTFKTTNTSAVYTGTFTNNGTYISDPATQYFKDLIVGRNGYLFGKWDDKFNVSGDFMSSSTMKDSWDTSNADLAFVHGASENHKYLLSSFDHGARMSGYRKNFSWGTLDVTGNNLYLNNGNSGIRAGLYVKVLLGIKAAGNVVTNVFGTGELNIYYLSDRVENSYLRRGTYNLMGGGQLIPIRRCMLCRILSVFFGDR